jgi:hypothetical protein
MCDVYVGRKIKRLLKDETGSTLLVPIYGVVTEILDQGHKGRPHLWRVRFRREDIDQYRLSDYEDLSELEVVY